MVFAGIFPTDSAQYEDLRDALSKLRMNDAAFVYEPDTSEALGFGFRCGFLGLLHMEIIQERLEREYNLDLITTAPSVVYHVYMNDGSMKTVENPAKLPPPATSSTTSRSRSIGSRSTCPPSTWARSSRSARSGAASRSRIQYASADRVIITYELPLSEVLFDFHDKLKSVSRGYASMDYELVGYRADDLVKLDMLVNGEPLDALSVIVHREKAYQRGRDLAVKLKDIVPRQQYEVAIQAAIGSKVIARTTVKALRKDVTPSATAATSAASASCSRSRKRARSA
jgi:GTP-binding protein LepA